MNEYIYTWIAFHGITDILLPINIWCPIYTLSLLSYFIPMNILNFITILTSTVHFTNDLYFFNCNDLYFFNCNDILLCLLLLLYFGEYKFPQYIILSYMSIIHVPIHLIKLHYDYITLLLLFSTYMIFYNINILQDILKKIIESGGRLPNNKYHKLLLGVINAHTICNYFLITDKQYSSV